MIPEHMTWKDIRATGRQYTMLGYGHTLVAQVICLTSVLKLISHSLFEQRLATHGVTHFLVP